MMIYDPPVQSIYKVSLAHQNFIDRTIAGLADGSLLVLVGPGPHRKIVTRAELHNAAIATQYLGWRVSQDPRREIDALNESARQIMACWN